MSRRAWLTPEERKARMKAKQAEYRARPEVKARKKASRAEYETRPEVKARKRAYAAEYRARTQVKARIEAYRAEYHSRPEVKARRNAQSAKRNSQPVVKEQIRAKTYSLSVEDLRALLAAGCMAAVVSPSNRCAGRMNIDHDRGCCNRDGSCGKCVRGALCHKHNTALSQYESSLSWAGKYLARHQAKQEGGRS